MEVGSQYTGMKCMYWTVHAHKERLTMQVNGLDALLAQYTVILPYFMIHGRMSDSAVPWVPIATSK